MFRPAVSPIYEMRFASYSVDSLRRRLNLVKKIRMIETSRRGELRVTADSAEVEIRTDSVIFSTYWRYAVHVGRMLFFSVFFFLSNEQAFEFSCLIRTTRRHEVFPANCRASWNYLHARTASERSHKSNFGFQ